MRICHVIESAGGGSGQVVIDLVGYGLSHGDDVTVVYAPERAAPDFIATLEAMPAVKLRQTPMRRAVGLHDLLHAWKLWRLLRRIGPFDVVHSHSSKAGALARLTGLLLWPRAAQIYTPHAFVTLAPDASKIYAPLERILSWCGDKVIALSAIEAKHARDDLGIAAHKLAVVPNGIALEHAADRATARSKLGWPEESFVVGVVGRLATQKNPLRVLAAFAQFAADHPQARLAILGDGPLQDAVDAALAQPPLDGKAKRLAGQRGRDYMPAFDALLCGSDYEGFAVVFLEALAAGVPIVTTPVGGAQETVREGVSGFIADFTPEALAAGLARLAAMPEATRVAMAAREREWAQAFTINIMGERTKAVYDDALASRRRKT